MKKLLLTLFLLFGLCRVGYCAISTISYVTPDDVTIDTLEANRVTFTDAINSADGALIQAGSITTAQLDDNANPENRWNEGFNDFVFTGLTIPTSASLSSTTASGTLYMNGVRVVKDATAHTYTASKHTYVDLSDNGTYTYSEVTINASAPAVATDSLRLARVSTDATTGVSVRDDRVTEISIAAGSAGSILDTDADTGILTEDSTDEDVLRFKIGDTTLSSAREVLTIQAIDANDVKIEPTTDVDVDLGSSSKKFKVMYIDEVSADDVSLNTSAPAEPIRNKLYKDNVVKGWISFNGTGGIAINDDFNVSSITDSGTGLYVVVWSTDFANTNYAVVSTASEFTTTHASGNLFPGSTEVTVNDSGGSNVDTAYIGVIIMGDQ